MAKSTRYIWCTANLGKSTLTGERALGLLNRGGSVQPTSFWITDSGDLKIGVAIDNRDVTPAHMKFVMEKRGNNRAPARLGSDPQKLPETVSLMARPL